MKVFLTKINESWIVDKMRSEFYSFHSEITTERIKNADIVWVIAPWLANDLKKTLPELPDIVSTRRTLNEEE